MKTKKELESMKPSELIDFMDSDEAWDDYPEEIRTFAYEKVFTLFPIDSLQEDINELQKLVTKLRVDVDKIKDLHNIDAKLDLIINTLKKK